MHKMILAILMFYCAPLWAGLGDPVTYTLTVPPSAVIPPTLSPYSLPVPHRPDIAPTEDIVAEEPFTARLDSLRRMKKKIRVVNAEKIQGLPVLCHAQIRYTLCQANYIQVVTDQDAFIQSPLDRLTPSSYFAISGFTDYFDLGIQGFTPCTVDISCEYITKQ